jgi:hypothetical protein
MIGNTRNNINKPEERGDGEWSIATLLKSIEQKPRTLRWNAAGNGNDLAAIVFKDGTLNNLDDETPAVQS